MWARATLLLLAALPALAGVGVGVGVGVAAGEVVSVAGRPSFAPQPTLVLARPGQAASLDCTVLGLADKSVSWVRARDLQILAHAGAVFTADARVSAASAGGRHSLRIASLRATDAGRYECQVNTEPKMSLFFNLTVVDEPVPVVVLSAVGPTAVSGEEGGAATLACEARYEPPPRLMVLAPLDVHWRRHGETISSQSSRGGVSLDTERWAARARSRLTLGELAPADAGAYECRAAGRALPYRLRVRPAHGLGAERMQRDQPAGGAAPPPRRAGVAAFTALLLLAR